MHAWMDGWMDVLHRARKAKHRSQSTVRVCDPVWVPHLTALCMPCFMARLMACITECIDVFGVCSGVTQGSGDGREGCPSVLYSESRHIRRLRITRLSQLYYNSHCCGSHVSCTPCWLASTCISPC